MPSQRSNVTKATGLYTFLSELSAPEGAQVVADNVNINELGVITPRRGTNDYGQALTDTADRVKQILEYKERILRHFNTTIQFDDGSGNFSTFDGSFSEVEPGFRIKFQESNGNLYFTSSDGIKKISAKSASQLSTSANYITNAGAPKAVDINGKVQPTSGGFLPPQSKVAYKLLFGYTDKNNNLILGSPSSRQVITNTSEDRFTPESIFIDFINGEAGSNYLENYWVLYSKDTKYYIWYNDSAGSKSEPRTSDTLGATGIEVIIANPNTAIEVASATANAIDAIIGDKFEVNLDSVNADITLTSIEDGNITDPEQGSILIADMTVETLQEGSVSEGSNSNVELSFIVPEGVTTDYFYQIYRTSNVTVDDGLTTLNDIDPGEDANLVIENPVTVAAGSVITITDTTPSTFRDTGVPLYNNPISGQGLLQTNDRPPIAKDIENFSNYTFYSNTKTFHRYTFNMVSVDDFGDLETDFIVGNEDGISVYTFQGKQEVTTIDCGTVADTTETTGVNDSYIILYSAGDERKYHIWFDKGTGVEPTVANSIGIRVNLAGTGVVPGDNVAQYLADSLSLVDDFTIVENATDVVITTLNNGDTTDADTPTSTPATDIGTGWAITVNTQGTGEDTVGNKALWSILPSVGQSIEQTARSLVSVINQDVSSPVNAFYLSGANDLPGQILLENKNLEDKPFYVGVENTGSIGSNISGEFNPNIPTTKSVVNITISGDETVVEVTGHGYSEGDSVYIYAPNNTPALSSSYEISSVTTNDFAIQVTTTSADATGAFTYSASQESDNSEAPNRLYYSKLGQPEAVPIANFINIGEKDKAIERILSLRDNLFVLKEDGTYIVSGTPPFSVRLLDNTSTIIAPDSAKVMNNQIFSLNDDGIVTINETGVSLISRPIENLILKVTDEDFDVRLKSFGVSYESDKSYFLWLPTLSTDTIATQAYRYNIFERTWTRWTIPSTSGYASSKNRLYIADGERNYLLRERKNRDRTDYSDRNFTLIVGNNAIVDKTIRLSTTSDVVIGDVLVQEQQVTVTMYNSLLSKLELDSGVSTIVVSSDAGTDTLTATSHGLADDDLVNLDGSIYYIINSTVNTFQLSETSGGSVIDLDGTESVVNRLFDNFEIGAGANIATALTSLNNKLVSIGLSITAHVYNNADWDDLKVQFNDFIDELNSASSGTRYKNYRKVTETTTYESITVDKRDIKNEVDVLFSPLFLEGNIEVYKSIQTEVQWSPLHFGDPSSQKQISKGTVIIDQNNFTKATVSYSSDLSQDFIPINVTGKGVGYWGSATWGQPDLYWGGNGNDVPIMNIIPREKQRCRYLNVKFEHRIAREDFRILGITAIVRIVSDRAYR